MSEGSYSRSVDSVALSLSLSASKIWVQTRFSTNRIQANFKSYLVVLPLPHLSKKQEKPQST